MIRLFSPLLALFLLSATSAWALVMQSTSETFSSSALPRGEGEWNRVVDLLNSPGRHYWRDKHFSGFGMDRHEIVAGYRGTADGLNRILKVLREKSPKEDVEVVLLPGTGAVPTLKGEKVECHWRIRILYVNTYLPPNSAEKPSIRCSARLEVYLPPIPKPPTPVSADQVNQWIADLRSDNFSVRQQAQKGLERHAYQARSALERAIASAEDLEQRRRIELVLKSTEALRREDLNVPEGLRVRTLEEVLRAERSAALSREAPVHWPTHSRIREFLEGSPSVRPVVEEVLGREITASLIQSTPR